MDSLGIKEGMLRESGWDKKSAPKGCTLFIWDERVGNGLKPFPTLDC